MMYHEIRIIDKRVEEVGGLDEFEAFVSERNDAAVEADSCRHLALFLSPDLGIWEESII